LRRTQIPGSKARYAAQPLEAYDRGRKVEHYRALASFRQYGLVASERIGTELHTRQPDDPWLLRFGANAEDVIGLDSVGARLLVSEIYSGVEFG
jgi:hypothetical protein